MTFGGFILIIIVLFNGSHIDDRHVLLSNVPILGVLCSRHYTAKTAEIQPLLTSKTDSAQNFGLVGMEGVVVKVYLWLIIHCDASWWRCFCEV